jgi:hypothetical protein
LKQREKEYGSVLRSVKTDFLTDSQDTNAPHGALSSRNNERGPMKPVIYVQ